MCQVTQGSYHQLIYSEGAFRGDFFLEGERPKIYIKGNIITIGCKEMTLEAFDELAKQVALFRKSASKVHVIQQ